MVIPGSNPGGPANQLAFSLSEFKRPHLAMYCEREVNHMSFLHGQSASAGRVVSRFTRYLNGPMGKSVLDNLEEGEHFILQTSDHTFRVTKKNGCAIVEILQVQLA